MGAAGEWELTEPERAASSKALRAGFWLACVSLTLSFMALVSAPTSRMTPSQIMPLLLASGVLPCAALVVLCFAKGRVWLRVGGFMLGVLSLAAWLLLVWWNALFVLNPQFVR